MSGLKEYIGFPDDPALSYSVVSLEEQARAGLLLLLSSPAVLVCTLVLIISHISESGSWVQFPLLALLPLALMCVLLLARFMPTLKTIGGGIMIVVFTMVLSQQSQHDARISTPLYHP